MLASRAYMCPGYLEDNKLFSISTVYSFKIIHSSVPLKDSFKYVLCPVYIEAKKLEASFLENQYLKSWALLTVRLPCLNLKWVLGHLKLELWKHFLRSFESQEMNPKCVTNFVLPHWGIWNNDFSRILCLSLIWL